jgi:hypothetical protein
VQASTLLMTNFFTMNIAHYDESREFTFNDFTSEAFKAGRGKR